MTEEEVRAAFREADARSPMRYATAWQVWRDAFAACEALATPAPAQPEPKGTTLDEKSPVKSPAEGAQEDEPAGLKFLGTVVSDYDSNLVFRIYTKDFCRHDWVDMKDVPLLNAQICSKCDLHRSGNEPAPKEKP